MTKLFLLTLSSLLLLLLIKWVVGLSNLWFMIFASIIMLPALFVVGLIIAGILFFIWLAFAVAITTPSEYEEN